MTFKEKLMEIMRELHESTKTKDVTVIILCKDVEPFCQSIYGYRLENNGNTGTIYLFATDKDGINQVINSAITAAKQRRNGKRCED